jgi:phospholipase C
VTPLDPERRPGGPLDGREGEERFAAEQPGQHLRRREFIARTAALAGAAGLGASLPLNSLLSAAASQQARVPYPKPRDLPIDHFVVLMMENRSFDHYLGWRAVLDGRPAPPNKNDHHRPKHNNHQIPTD